MNRMPFTSRLVPWLMVLTAAWGVTAAAATSVSSIVSSSVTGGSARVEAVVTGTNALIVVNGDRVAIREGRLSVNGVDYGSVAAQSTVTYRVEEGVKTLLVDGVPRQPDD